MNIRVEWKKILNHRVLVSDGGQGRFEYIVRETSPSGQNVRFQNRGGNYFWADQFEYQLIEDLGLVESPKVMPK